MTRCDGNPFATSAVSSGVRARVDCVRSPQSRASLLERAPPPFQWVEACVQREFLSDAAMADRMGLESTTVVVAVAFLTAAPGPPNA